MSDHVPSLMPSDEEINSACNEDDHPDYQPSEVAFVTNFNLVRALIASAVEKALAEQREQHATALLRARKGALDFAISCYAEEKAEQEARHRREVLQAKIDTLDDLWHATKRDHSGKAVEVAFASHVTPSFIREEVNRLAAELAALDAGEEAKP